MRTVLITGAAQGIGLAMARRFLAGGYAVVASDRLSDGLEQLRADAPDRIAPIVQDVTADSAPEEAVALAAAHFGRLDVLVNNAGIGRAKPVGEERDEDLDRFLAVNVRAPLRYTRAALRAMEPGASIVNVASIFGFRGSAGAGVYSVTKAAMVGLTRQMAADYGPEGIRVNAVAPGVTRTAMTADRIDSGEPAFQRLMVNTTPFPRVGTPEDIANGAFFLASEEASFISGHVLVIDGGWLAANAPRN